MSKRKFVLFALVAALVLGLAGVAMAGDYVWTGTTDGNWSTQTNWLPDPGASNYPGKTDATDTVTINAAEGRTLTLDVAVGTLNGLTIAPGEGGITTPVTIKTADGKNLTFATSKTITANSDLVISGAGKVVFATGGTFAVDEDITVDVQVPVDSAPVTKTGKGTLIYSAPAVPEAGFTAQTVTLGDGTGTFTIGKRGLAALIALGKDTTLNLTGDATLDTTGTSGVTIAASANPAANAATVNVRDGAKIQAGDSAGSFGFTVTTGGHVKINVAENSELTLGKTGAGGAINTTPGNAYVSVADDAVLKVGQAAILVGSLTVEEKGKVVLEIPSVAGDFFSFGGNSVISGDVSGSGYLMLTPGATQVIKLLGNNSHYGGTLAGTVTPAGTVIAPTAAGGTVEILNDKSLGTAPLHFTTTPGGVLRVAKDAPDFTLSNPITTTVAGTIDVPAGVELKLSGSLTAPAALAKAGAGDLRLAGYAQGATIGGINVNTGTLVLDEDSVAGTNAITVATGAALKPAHSGIRHMGALTFAASSKLLGLTEANKDGPLIIAEGALTITAPLIVETAYAPGATWLTTEALQVAEYTTAIAGPIPNNPVRAVNANGDNLSIHAAAAQVSPRYSVLSITPSKDHVFPEAGTGTATTDPVEGQVSSDGAFSASTPLKAADGSAATSASVDTDSEGYKALEAVGLKAEIVDNNRLVVSGDPTDIVDTSVTVLVNGVPQEVKVSVKAYDSPDEITDTETAPDWETTLSTGSDGTTTLFVTYIPSLEDLTGKTVKDIYAYGTGGITITATTVVTASERIASRGASATHFFKVTGTVTDLETAEIARVTYRVGVNRYSQAVGVLLSDTDVKGVYKKSPGSGGGCDAGFGLFGLLAATGAVALLRRKG